MTAAQSALERFLQLTGDLVGRGIHVALHDLGGLGERLVESLFDRQLADRDEPCLVSGELLSRLDKLLARQRPAPEHLWDETDARPVQPPDHVGLAVPQIDHGRVDRADQLVVVQLLDGGQVIQRGIFARIRCGVDDHLLVLSHGISQSGYPMDESYAKPPPRAWLVWAPSAARVKAYRTGRLSRRPRAGQAEARLARRCDHRVGSGQAVGWRSQLSLPTPLPAVACSDQQTARSYM